MEVFSLPAPFPGITSQKIGKVSSISWGTPSSRVYVEESTCAYTALSLPLYTFCREEFEM